jgi:acyl carrier protein
MSKFASSVVSFCVGHWTGRAFWARVAFQTAEEAPKPHIHPTHLTYDRTLNACRSAEVYQIDTRLQNACIYANLSAIAAWEELQLQPDKFEPEDKITNVVHQLLKERGADKPFNLQDNLLSVGLTSLDMTNLVLSIEGEFLIRIPDRVITPVNFRSVATIGRLLRDLMASSVDSAARPFESPTDRADAAPAGS